MKSKAVAIFLSFFFGGFGAHNYYLGYKKDGIIQSVGFLSRIVADLFQAYSPVSAIVLLLLKLFGGIVSIWVFVDFIALCTGKMKPAEGEFKSKATPERY